MKNIAKRLFAKQIPVNNTFLICVTSFKLRFENVGTRVRVSYEIIVKSHMEFLHETMQMLTWFPCLTLFDYDFQNLQY